MLVHGCTQKRLNTYAKKQGGRFRHFHLARIHTKTQKALRIPGYIFDVFIARADEFTKFVVLSYVRTPGHMLLKLLMFGRMYLSM